MNSNNFCVIMAGGVGSRFWPLSRTEQPKQFIDILGTGRTLLQMTFDRFKDICPPENIYIVTNQVYKEKVAEQLPEIGNHQILLEPSRRNTGPCIAYANHKIKKKNKKACIVTAPADHMILKEAEFKNIIQKGLEFACKNDALLTLGIKPSRPETGYGYIQFNQNKNIKKNNNIYKVKTFTEKPNQDIARAFYESGEFLWNSGIFIWSLDTINQSFENYLPEVNNLFDKINDHFDTEKEITEIEKVYYECPNISIDYGIMEKAENVFVYKSDFGWADLGTWGSLHEHLKKDTNNNAIQGENVFIYDSNDCTIKVPKDKLVVIQGLTNYVVVESKGVLLICNKESEQSIKNFVNDVKIKLGHEYL